MEALRKFDNKTEIDIKTALSLFGAFIIVFSLIGYVGANFFFEAEIFGASVGKHISDLMIEHEARKSIALLSGIVVVLGVIRTLLRLASIKITEWVDKYIFLSSANFLIELVFVMIAITFSVILTVPDPFSMYTGFLFSLGLRNIFLFLSIVVPVCLLFASSDSKPTISGNIILPAAILSFHFLLLTCYWKTICGI